MAIDHDILYSVQERAAIALNPSMQFNSIQFFISFRTGQYNFNCLSNYLYQ